MQRSFWTLSIQTSLLPKELVSLTEIIDIVNYIYNERNDTIHSPCKTNSNKEGIKLRKKKRNSPSTFSYCSWGSQGKNTEGVCYSLLQWTTLATWCKELTHLKRPWCWERLRAGGEGDDRRWDDWMASPTRWTWVWVDSGSWWWTGELGVLWFMGSQGVRHDWATELNWTEPST